MQQHGNLPSLHELDKYKLVNEAQDVRGRPLLTRNGRRLGVIKRMLVDRDHERVAALVLDNGETVRVEEVELRGGDVIIDEVGGPAPAGRPVKDGAAEQRIPIVEEQVAVGKRAVERGHIRVTSHVVEKPVEESIRLRDEHVEVERRPVGKPLAGDPEAAFQNRTVEVSEIDEEPVVEKRAEVVDEVVVRKTADERTAHVSDKVRRTEVDVDPVKTPPRDKR